MSCLTGRCFFINYDIVILRARNSVYFAGPCRYNSTQPITEGVDTTQGCLVPSVKMGTLWQPQRNDISGKFSLV